MNSPTSLVARQCRLEGWAAQVQDCNNRPQGMSVKEWCSQHGVTVANYYYRLTQVRKACLEKLSGTDTTQSVVPVPSELITDTHPSSIPSEIKISRNDFCIHVTKDASPELLKMVLEVVSDVK